MKSDFNLVQTGKIILIYRYGITQIYIYKIYIY